MLCAGPCTSPRALCSSTLPGIRASSVQERQWTRLDENFSSNLAVRQGQMTKEVGRW